MMRDKLKIALLAMLFVIGNSSCVLGQQESSEGTSLLSIISAGGLLMAPIALCSLILGMFSLERAMSLRRARIIPRPFVKRILEQLKAGELDKREAYRICREHKSPVATVLAAGVRRWRVAWIVVTAANRLTRMSTAPGAFLGLFVPPASPAARQRGSEADASVLGGVPSCTADGTASI